MSQSSPGITAHVHLSRQQWLSIGGMAAFVAALHVVGFGVLLLIVAPRHYQTAGGAFGLGIGLTAYTLGMRHAFDADHIAAIDNTTRKLMGEGKQPVSVGFWFSLGHSSVVFVLVTLLGIGVKSLAHSLSNSGSTLETTTGLFGTAISGTFLLLIGIVNLVVLRQILGVSRKMREGEFDEATLEDHLANRGLINRLLRGVTKSVTTSWHMYPIGLLFGLGFDTVTEVGLLVIAGGAAAVALPWYAIMTLPILFAAGMSLLDSIDGCFMNFAYGWAFSNPVRKVFYNITITGLSVAVALLIGGVEILSIVVDRLHITSGPLAALGALDLNHVGYAIVALFLVAWVGALTYYKVANVEQKWGSQLTDAGVELGDVIDLEAAEGTGAASALHH